MTQLNNLDKFKEVDFEGPEIKMHLMKPQCARQIDDLPDTSFVILDKATGDFERLHYGVNYEPMVDTKVRDRFSYPPLTSRNMAQKFVNMLTEFGLGIRDEVVIRYLSEHKFTSEVFNAVLRQKYNTPASVLVRDSGTVFNVPFNGATLLRIYPRPENSDSMFENYTSGRDQYDILRGAATFNDVNYSWSLSNPHAEGFGLDALPSILDEIKERLDLTIPWLMKNDLLMFHSINRVHPAEINFGGNNHG